MKAAKDLPGHYTFVGFSNCFASASEAGNIAKVSRLRRAPRNGSKSASCIDSTVVRIVLCAIIELALKSSRILEAGSAKQLSRG